MTDKKLKKLQRYLVYVLRHNPKELNLELGAEGFVTIHELLENLKKQNRHREVTAEMIHQVVQGQTNKQRLEIQGEKIRCRYGHSDSATPEIEYEPAEPPDRLYHGTPLANLESIQEMGLVPGKRKYVHLTTSAKLARGVGERHDREVVVLEVLCDKARERGLLFYNPEAQIWLVSFLPPEFLIFP